MNYKNNIFYIEKIKAANLIKKFGSPIYCYSNRRLVDNINNFKNSFKKFNPLICFSVKSNYNSTIINIIDKDISFNYQEFQPLYYNSSIYRSMEPD